MKASHKKFQKSASTVGMQILRGRSVPQWACDIIVAAAEKHDVLLTSILIECRRRPVTAARDEAIYLIKRAKMSLSAPQIARWFGKEHSTVLHSMVRHVERTGDEPVTDFNIRRDR